jgi:SAM-dependent methyltransferase
MQLAHRPWRPARSPWLRQTLRVAAVDFTLASPEAVAAASHMDAHQLKEYQTSYDRVADEYVRRISDELRHKPLDRELLDRFAASVRGVAPACDLGCGPGHVARYLHEQGVEISGIDLSEAMVEQARRLNPAIEFRRGDMMALDVPDKTWAGIAAFYSIIHIPRPDMVQTLAEWRRVLQPGGLLLLAFHIGDDPIHLDEWWGRPVCVDFFFFRPSEIAGYLAQAGLAVEEIHERDPYPEIEHQSRRSYIFARRPYR